MSTFEVRVYPPDRSPPKEAQLAWKLAAMATAPWPATSAIDEMVVNRIIDNAACAIAGINRGPVANARAQALAHPRKGGATLFAMPASVTVDCEWAAWANSTAVRELDFHDTFMAIESSHPGDNIASLVAVAEQCGRSGADLVRGIATAYQIQVDLAKAMGLAVHQIDHVAYLGPSIAGGIGALLDLDTEVVYQAIGHAAHVSTATRQARKGDISTWKACAPGHVGKCAIEAIDRAMRGETSPSPLYEGDYGIVATLLDGPTGEYRVSLPDPGEPRAAILETYTKEYSAGYHGQPLIDLAFRMRGAIPDRGAIERIEIHTKSKTHRVMGSGSGDPQKYDPDASRETLDHSSMYIFAVALEDGEWHHERSYAPSRRARPETLALWRKIVTVESDEWNRRFDEPPALDKDQGARVEVTFANGERMVDEIAVADSHPRGARPFDRAQYIAKFQTLAEGVLSGADIERFLDLAGRLTELPAGGLAGINVAGESASLECAVRDERGIF